MRKVNLLIKRLGDILASGLGMILLCIPFALISLWIKLTSKGPVFFRQERLGKGGKTFRIFKFRTMVVNAEKTGDGLFVYGNNVSRITSAGRVLRTTSLDELPQLLNVLKGDMSIVGPRPPVVYFPYDGYQNYPEWAKKRFSMRPGITGLAQVRTRTTAPWDERIVIDNEYVDRFSVALDLKILVQTAVSVLKHQNVYPESAEQINNNPGHSDKA